MDKARVVRNKQKDSMYLKDLPVSAIVLFSYSRGSFVDPDGKRKKRFKIELLYVILMCYGFRLVWIMFFLVKGNFDLIVAP